VTFRQLLDEIYRCGVSYSATADGKLRIDAPAGQVSDALRAALPAHREALLRHLANGADGRWQTRVAFSPAFGWLRVTDPATGEVHELPTRLTPPLQAQHPDVPLSPAPKWMVRRAMERKAALRKGGTAPPA
jgi:TubC N-terminal docking domain